VPRRAGVSRARQAPRRSKITPPKSTGRRGELREAPRELAAIRRSQLFSHPAHFVRDMSCYMTSSRPPICETPGLLGGPTPSCLRPCRHPWVCAVASVSPLQPLICRITTPSLHHSPGSWWSGSSPPPARVAWPVSTQVCPSIGLHPSAIITSSSRRFLSS
jgi:hypothetical protein